jgi:hypothetical protein
VPGQSWRGGRARRGSAGCRARRPASSRACTGWSGAGTTAARRGTSLAGQRAARPGPGPAPRHLPPAAPSARQPGASYQTRGAVSRMPPANTPARPDFLRGSRPTHSHRWGGLQGFSPYYTDIKRTPAKVGRLEETGSAIFSRTSPRSETW